MPERHQLQLTRLPGADAVLTIDGIAQRVVYIKVTSNVTLVTYETDNG